MDLLVVVFNHEGKEQPTLWMVSIQGPHGQVGGHNSNKDEC